MPKYSDLMGHKFGKLTAISFIPEKRKWNCICDCGKKTKVFSSNLKRKNTQSCGCLNTHHKFSDETMSAKRALYASYKNQCAKKRGYSFFLKFEEFIHITQQDCHYCGKSPGQFCNRKYYSKIFFYNGLDRLDSNKDYEIDNVVPCCKECNRAKWDKNKNEFVAWLKRCFKHLKLTGLL